jgi:hypothetical protein
MEKAALRCDTTRVESPARDPIATKAGAEKRRRLQCCVAALRHALIEPLPEPLSPTATVLAHRRAAKRICCWLMFQFGSSRTVGRGLLQTEFEPGDAGSIEPCLHRDESTA